MNMPLVVISQRVDHIPERNEIRDSLDQNLSRWVLAAGYLPAPLPNTLSNHLIEWLSNIMPQGIILSGGNDLGSESERDVTEMQLIEWALQNKRPLLGICRGMQMIAHYFGTGLIPVKHHIATQHRINSLESRRHFPAIVNSYHGYAIEACPEHFQVTACSEEGNIEAILHTHTAIEGWMWHPERDQNFDPLMIQQLKQFFSQSV